jgi:hypothetical protein
MLAGEHLDVQFVERLPRQPLSAANVRDADSLDQALDGLVKAIKRRPTLMSDPIDSSCNLSSEVCGGG